MGSRSSPQSSPRPILRDNSISWTLRARSRQSCSRDWRRIAGTTIWPGRRMVSKSLSARGRMRLSRSFKRRRLSHGSRMGSGCTWPHAASWRASPHAADGDTCCKLASQRRPRTVESLRTGKGGDKERGRTEDPRAASAVNRGTEAIARQVHARSQAGRSRWPSASLFGRCTETRRSGGLSGGEQVPVVAELRGLSARNWSPRGRRELVKPDGKRIAVGKMPFGSGIAVVEVTSRAQAPRLGFRVSSCSIPRSAPLGICCRTARIPPGRPMAGGLRSRGRWATKVNQPKRSG